MDVTPNCGCEWMTPHDSEMPPESQNPPELLPARMVNEFVYCPRLAYLEWVQGEWDDNLDTVQGRFAHRRVDRETIVEVPEIDPENLPPDAPRSTRSLTLSSTNLGVIAKVDLVEFDGAVAVPIDYKRGKVPENDQQSWPPERVQLTLQGLLLREQGYQVETGILYYVASKTRVEIELDVVEELHALEAVAGLRTLAESGKLPPPLVESPKCIRCSLAGICLPDEINRLAHPDLPADTRRLVPARDDRLPLYVQAQGSTINKRGERLIITARDQPPVEVRLMEVSHLALFGNVQVTTQTMHALLEHDIPVAYLSQGGWFYGLATGLGHKNVELRMAQHRLADSGECLAIARSIVSGKVLNQRTLLRRNLPERDLKLVGRLALFARQARHAKSAATLLGTEGIAAHDYFGNFHRLFRGAGEWAGPIFAAGGRNRRPPRDEVNAVLSFLYAMLTRECTVAAQLVGFDPFRGFYHVPKYGRPALGLDLCEEFRPLIADSVCLTLFNQGELRETDFIRRARGVALTPEARKTVLTGFERRMSQLITHPVFGYTVSYRRVIEVQARLLRAVVLGEIPGYRPLTTR